MLRTFGHDKQKEKKIIWRLTGHYHLDTLLTTQLSHTVVRGALRLGVRTKENDCTKFISLNASTSTLPLRDRFGSAKFMKDAIITAFSEISFSQNDKKARGGIRTRISQSVKTRLRNASKSKQCRLVADNECCRNLLE